MEVDDGPEGKHSINQWVQVKYTGLPPRQRSLHAGIAVGECLYIFGGYDGSNRVNDFYRFNFKTSKWTQLPASSTLPSARDRHVVVPYDEKIFVFGGYDGNNRINDFWQYDTEHEAWALVMAQWASLQLPGIATAALSPTGRCTSSPGMMETTGAISIASTSSRGSGPSSR